MFVETAQAIYFYQQREATYGFLSNFWPCSFTDERGQRFSSSEQCFMKQKQELFDPDNVQLAVELLRAKAPPVAKKLGRQVRHYDDAVWGEKRFAAMVTALKLKFSQNEELRAKLLATGGKRLYEAAPRDAIWGIGLSVKHIAELFREDEEFRRSGDVDMDRQRECFGQNLLGKALMETRMWLRERDHEQSGAATTTAESIQVHDDDM